MLGGLAAGAGAALCGGVGRPATAAPNGYWREWDNFRNGFTVANQAGAPDAKWFHFAAGPYVGNDGIATTFPSHGLSVRSAGTNPATGAPAFSLTLGQEGAGDNPLGLPGGIDHLKWLMYMNHVASSGYPGFDAVAGASTASTSPSTRAVTRWRSRPDNWSPGSGPSRCSMDTFLRNRD